MAYTPLSALQMLPTGEGFFGFRGVAGWLVGFVLIRSNFRLLNQDLRVASFEVFTYSFEPEGLLCQSFYRFSGYIS